MKKIYIAYPMMDTYGCERQKDEIIEKLEKTLEECEHNNEVVDYDE